jgi:hypothetical protein
VDGCILKPHPAPLSEYVSELGTDQVACLCMRKPISGTAPPKF